MTKNNTTEWKEKIRFAMAHIDGADASDVDNMCSLFESLLSQAAAAKNEAVYCVCGDMLEKDWLGFGGRVCAACEPVAKAEIERQARTNLLTALKAVLGEKRDSGAGDSYVCGKDAGFNELHYTITRFIKEQEEL